MSGELWAIIGVVVGTVGTGGLGLLQATLQRRWAVGDRNTAWEQERQNRLFEKKQEAHLTFLDEYHTTIAILQSHDRLTTDERIALGKEFVVSMANMTHRLSKLAAYASTVSVECAAAAAQALVPYGHAVIGGKPSDPQAEASNLARGRYINALRADLGVDDADPILARVMRSIMDAESSANLDTSS